MTTKMKLRKMRKRRLSKPFLSFPWILLSWRRGRGSYSRLWSGVRYIYKYSWSIRSRNVQVESESESEFESSESESLHSLLEHDCLEIQKQKLTRIPSFESHSSIA